MANASAKKSAAAQAQIAAFYRPFLLMVNGLYVALRYFWLGWAWRGWWADGVPLASIAALQWYAYAGILDKAAAFHKKKGDSNSLVGGSSLDLLAVTLAVQFGAVLWTPKLYLALWLVPVWGAYSLYTTFLGGGSNKKNNTGAAFEPQQSAADAREDANSAGKRQKRAEKRRHKWS